MFSSLLKFPLTDPVLIFSVILFIILLAPIILHRFKIPDLIGLILAGALIGPNGLGIMARDSSIELDSVPKSVYVLLFSIIFANLFFFNKINSILRNYK